MRIAAISDIHGNRPALRAVFGDMPPVDLVVCAGDVVGYNPWPGACVSTVRDRSIPTVKGNHDRAVATGDTAGFNRLATEGVRFARNELNPDALEWLERLPDERTLVDGRVKVVHGHPADPDRYTYPRDFSPDLLTNEDVLVLGHTHVQHSEIYEDCLVCNPGSVGQPRDGDPRAAYAVIDLDSLTVDECRVAYDIDTVERKIHTVGLPPRLGSRLHEGR